MIKLNGLIHVMCLTEKTLHNDWLLIFFIQQTAIRLLQMSNTAASNEDTARNEVKINLILLKASGKTDFKTQVHKHS